VKRGPYTEIARCSVVELEALDRSIRGVNQYLLFYGITPWTKKARGYLDRLRAIRGLHVREHGDHVTITGSIDPNGFARVIHAPRES
jgi:hypothetical protein